MPAEGRSSLEILAEDNLGDIGDLPVFSQIQPVLSRIKHASCEALRQLPKSKLETGWQQQVEAIVKVLAKAQADPSEEKSLILKLTSSCKLLLDQQVRHQELSRIATKVLLDALKLSLLQQKSTPDHQLQSPAVDAQQQQQQHQPSQQQQNSAAWRARAERNQNEYREGSQRAAQGVADPPATCTHETGRPNWPRNPLNLQKSDASIAAVHRPGGGNFFGPRPKQDKQDRQMFDITAPKLKEMQPGDGAPAPKRFGDFYAKGKEGGQPWAQRGNRAVTTEDAKSAQSALAPRQMKQMRKPKRNARSGAQQSAELAGPITLDSDGEMDTTAEGADQGKQEAARPVRRSDRISHASSASTKDRFKGLHALFPPDGKNAVELTPSDLERLDPDEFLNDTIIDFYMKYIQTQWPEDVQKRIYIFNSFFLKKLTENTANSKAPGVCAKANHERVKKWTKGVDIFAKDFLIVPIHDSLHWSLLIVCHPGMDEEQTGRKPCMLHLDSLLNSGGHASGPSATAVRSYLQEEWKKKVAEGGSTVPAQWAASHGGAERVFVSIGKKVVMPALKLKALPKQDNYTDCGLFLLAYLHFFAFSLPKADQDLHSLMERANSKSSCAAADSVLEGEFEYPGFLTSQWFEKENASRLRKHVRNLVLQMLHGQALAQDRDQNSVSEALVDINDYNAHKGNKFMDPEAWLVFAQLKAMDRRKDLEAALDTKRRQKERDDWVKGSASVEPHVTVQLEDSPESPAPNDAADFINMRLDHPDQASAGPSNGSADEAQCSRRPKRTTKKPSHLQDSDDEAPQQRWHPELKAATAAAQTGPAVPMSSDEEEEDVNIVDDADGLQSPRQASMLAASPSVQASPPKYPPQQSSVDREAQELLAVLQEDGVSPFSVHRRFGGDDKPVSYEIIGTSQDAEVYTGQEFIAKLHMLVKLKRDAANKELHGKRMRQTQLSMGESRQQAEVDEGMGALNLMDSAVTPVAMQRQQTPDDKHLPHAMKLAASAASGSAQLKGKQPALPHKPPALSIASASPEQPPSSGRRSSADELRNVLMQKVRPDSRPQQQIQAQQSTGQAPQQTLEVPKQAPSTHKPQQQQLQLHAMQHSQTQRLAALIKPGVSPGAQQLTQQAAIPMQPASPANCQSTAATLRGIFFNAAGNETPLLGKQVSAPSQAAVQQDASQLHTAHDQGDNDDTDQGLREMMAPYHDDVHALDISDDDQPSARLASRKPSAPSKSKPTFTPAPQQAPQSATAITSDLLFSVKHKAADQLTAQALSGKQPEVFKVGYPPAAARQPSKVCMGLPADQVDMSSVNAGEGTCSGMAAAQAAGKPYYFVDHTPERLICRESEADSCSNRFGPATYRQWSPHTQPASSQPHAAKDLPAAGCTEHNMQSEPWDLQRSYSPSPELPRTHGSKQAGAPSKAANGWEPSSPKAPAAVDGSRPPPRKSPEQLMAHASARKRSRSAEILSAEADRKDQQLQQAKPDPYVFVDSQSPPPSPLASSPPERPTKRHSPDPGLGQPSQRPAVRQHHPQVSSVAQGNRECNVQQAAILQRRAISSSGQSVDPSYQRTHQAASPGLHRVHLARQPPLHTGTSKAVALCDPLQMNRIDHGGCHQALPRPIAADPLASAAPDLVEDSEDQAEQSAVTESTAPGQSLPVLRVDVPPGSSVIELGIHAFKVATAGARALSSSLMNKVSPPRKHQHLPEASARQQSAACCSPGSAAAGQQPKPITSQQPHSDAPSRPPQGIWQGQEQQPYARLHADPLPLPGNGQQSLSNPDPAVFSGMGGYLLPQKDRRLAQGISHGLPPSMQAQSQTVGAGWQNGRTRLLGMLGANAAQKPRTPAPAAQSPSLKDDSHLGDDYSSDSSKDDPAGVPSERDLLLPVANFPLQQQSQEAVIDLENDPGDDTPLGSPALASAMGSQPSKQEQELADAQLAASLQAAESREGLQGKRKQASRQKQKQSSDDESDYDPRKDIPKRPKHKRQGKLDKSSFSSQRWSTIA
ncbi:hypothetical protein WJX74_001856 [Apatococcus lobatus]|uniref:Ubiquitin-like protease family profile domain-containing protein n=1 Tax=Apatococcus lobatus TaxID=904363 RepID=A0AAW1QCI3_9CHLO